MDKLRKKKSDSPVNQVLAQNALNEKEAQENYLSTLREVKSQMYQEVQQGGKQEEVEEQASDMESKPKEQRSEDKKKKKRERKKEMRIMCNAELTEVFKLIAVHEGVSLSSYITDILETYLKENIDEIKKILKVKI